MSLTLVAVVIVGVVLTQQYILPEGSNIGIFFAAGVLLFYLYSKFTSQRKIKVPEGFKVAIVGAGFSGLGMAIKLKQMGVPFVIIEKASQVGGTWWYNHYPGIACDIPSHLYSYSYEKNPNWSSIYGKGAEIEAYLIHCAEKYNLYPHIQFNTTYLSSNFDNDTAKWRLQLRNTKENKEFAIEANVVVSGIGGLHLPKFPNIPGRETFQGKYSFHSSEWDHTMNLEKEQLRCAVIGSAASAIQIIPEIAKSAKHLYVLQRTPNWVSPRPKLTFSKGFQLAFKYIPGLMSVLRAWYYVRNELLYFFMFNPEGLLGRVNKFGRNMVVKYIQRVTKDRKCYDGSPMTPALIPDYPLGCKRILLSNDYYKTLIQPNTTLVTNSILRIEPKGVVVAVPSANGGGVTEQLIEVDVIIYATGFEILDNFQGTVTANGRNVSEVWGDRPQAYLGILIPNFPNYFGLLGPNTGLGHNSIIWIIECQVNFIAKCIQHLTENYPKYRQLEVKKEVMDSWIAKVQRKLKGSIWDRKYCVSWYQNASGYIYTLWPGGTYLYWWDTLNVSPSLFNFK